MRKNLGVFKNYFIIILKNSTIWVEKAACPCTMEGSPVVRMGADTCWCRTAARPRPVAARRPPRLTAARPASPTANHVDQLEVGVEEGLLFEKRRSFRTVPFIHVLNIISDSGTIIYQVRI